MDTIIWTLVLIGFLYSVYLAGHIAERRGRSFKVWAWIAMIIGPLALPLVFLFPDLHRKNVTGPEGTDVPRPS
jgi:MFS family permease